MTCDPQIVTKLEELLTAIRGFEDPRRAANEWKLVFKLLQKTDLPAVRVTNVVGSRDLVRLTELVDQLRTPAPATPQTPVDVPTTDACRRAFRAFRKRLELARLDDESKIGGHSQLSKGEASSLNAIIPPSEWPDSVWEELARQGRLHHVGHGFYALTKQQYD